LTFAVRHLGAEGHGAGTRISTKSKKEEKDKESLSETAKLMGSGRIMALLKKCCLWQSEP